MGFLFGTGFVVRVVLLILIGFSVLSWTIIIFKFFQIRTANSHSENVSWNFFWKSKRFNTIASQVDRSPRSP